MPPRSIPDRSHHTTLQLFSRNLSLSAGVSSIVEGERIVGPMRRGLKVAVMLDGRQSLSLDDRPTVMIGGPALLVAANSGDHEQRRVSLTGGPLRYALMQFDLDFVASELGVALETLFDLVNLDDAGFWVRPASATLRALALQMAGCSAADPLRGLFLAGKALELAALAIGEVTCERPTRPARLPARTRERVLAARDMLMEAAQEPPSLAELARSCGLNPTKLTSAFRAEFGTSVFGYLQEHRLQQAHAMLANGEATVAEAAFRVGYTPAHFSTLFRKRFGMSPRSVR